LATDENLECVIHGKLLHGIAAGMLQLVFEGPQHFPRDDHEKIQLESV
jgi:hypothetical protein